MKTIIAITEEVCKVPKGSIAGSDTSSVVTTARMVAIKVCLDSNYTGSKVMAEIGRHRTSFFYYRDAIAGLMYNKEFRDTVETVKTLLK